MVPARADVAPATPVVAAVPRASFSECPPLMLVPATWSTARDAMVPGGLPGEPSGPLEPIPAPVLPVVERVSLPGWAPLTFVPAT